MATDPVWGRMKEIEDRDLVLNLKAEIERLKQEVYRRDGVISAQNAALKHWRHEFDVEHALRLSEQGIEDRVADWVRSRIGEAGMTRKERAMRSFEEICELIQAEGITWNQAVAQVHHVYQRPKGDADKEGAAVALVVIGWCAAAGVKFMQVTLDELRRIENKPVEEVQASHARKMAAGLITKEGELEMSIKKVGFLTATFEIQGAGADPYWHGGVAPAVRSVTMELPLERVAPLNGAPAELEAEIKEMAAGLIVEDGACSVLVLGRRTTFGYVQVPDEPPINVAPGDTTADGGAVPEEEGTIP